MEVVFSILAAAGVAFALAAAAPRFVHWLCSPPPERREPRPEQQSAYR